MRECADDNTVGLHLPMAEAGNPLRSERKPDSSRLRITERSPGLHQHQPEQLLELLRKALYDTLRIIDQALVGN